MFVIHEPIMKSSWCRLWIVHELTMNNKWHAGSWTVLEFLMHCSSRTLGQEQFMNFHPRKFHEFTHEPFIAVLELFMNRCAIYCSWVIHELYHTWNSRNSSWTYRKMSISWTVKLHSTLTMQYVQYSTVSLFQMAWVIIPSKWCKQLCFYTIRWIRFQNLTN